MRLVCTFVFSTDYKVLIKVQWNNEENPITKIIMAASQEDYLSQLPPSKRNSVPTDQECAVIASVMTNWRLLIPYLGLANTVESDIIDANPQKPAIQRIEVLKYYRQRLGKEATFVNLVKSFYSATRRDLVDKVIEVAKSGDDNPPQHPLNNAATDNSQPSAVHSNICHCSVSVGAYSTPSGEQSLWRIHTYVMKWITVSNDLQDIVDPITTTGQPGTNTDHCVKHKISVDVHQVTTDLAEIANWESLCTALRLPEAIVNHLRHEPLEVPQKKLRCLAAYLKMDCPNWVTVIEIVCKYPFYNVRLAKELAKKYSVDANSIHKCS